ncbi:ABC transporter ATP-binding protein [Salinarimonas soli]|uniref:ABC transporter ATP-binding protein n=1 Tax=Salinarimonas soli TaxID=1638099 RepID=A0A5B2VH70_9HYPH|nr:ABC transporter ATP-binding protein [Salinarimonas soli]KAA2237958.1 ABC transporter ATP-binding protein [Salinarimonas soli]
MAIHAADFNELRLDRLSRAFGAVQALKDVTLTIRRGEFIALLGPSGCGKSTALNCLAGLLPSTGGGIWLDERRIDTLRPERRGFGMVFQNYALFPHMTVAKNVGFGLAMRGTPRAEIARRVEEAIGLVQLNGQEHKLPGQLSGGQQQRVAIARAIVIEPPLVLMDEPLSNLDAKLRLEMRAEIRRIHNTLGSTTIYVTHDQEEALSLADRIVVMRAGAVRQVGAPAELYAAPGTIDVAEFMGFRNRVEGTVTAIESGVATLSVDGGSLKGKATPGLKLTDRATLSARPEDMHPGDGAGLPVTVDSMEFRGREFVGYARTAAGAAMSFQAGSPVATGEVVRLVTDASRALVFPGVGL